MSEEAPNLAVLEPGYRNFRQCSSFTSELIRDSLSQGKTKNFAHPALQQVITEFYYLGSYRIADKQPDLFRQSVPIPCLALVAAAVCSSILSYLISNALVLV